jgi:hypothetical protein
MSNLYVRLTIITLAFFGYLSANAQLTYWLDESALNSPRKQRIIESMDSCVNAYNAFSNYTQHVRVIYDETIPTANAGYNGRIAFGGSISEKTALHEMSHVLGVGTYREWNKNRDDAAKEWRGEKAIAIVRDFDGPGVVLKADKWHFWPYGLNTKLEDVARHVYMVGALREDMGLSNTSGQGTMGPDCFPGRLFGNAILNNDATIEGGMAFPKIGDKVEFIPLQSQGSIDNAILAWTGPNGFSSSTPTVMFENIQMINEGTYTVSLTNKCNSTFEYSFSLNPSEFIPFYAIQLKVGGRLSPDNDVEGAEIIKAPDTGMDEWVQWQLIYTDNNWFYLKNRQTGKYFRPISMEVQSRMKLIDEGEIDEWAQWRIEASGDGFAHILNRKTGLKLRTLAGDFSNIYIEQTSAGSAGDWTRFQFVLLDDTDIHTSVNSISSVNNHVFKAFFDYTDYSIKIALDMSKSAFANVSVHNLKGQKVAEILKNKKINKGQNYIEYRLNEDRLALQPGIYIVHIESNGITVAEKISIVH